MKHIGRRLVLIGLAMLLPSCQTLTHQEAKLQAEQRWNGVRGRVKTQLAKQQFEGRLFEEAAATLIESLAIDPAQPDAYVLLARSNLELGKIATAREVVESARRAGLDSAELVYTEGVILEQVGDNQAAVDRYRRAWVLDPNSVDYLVAYAESLVAEDCSSDALALLSHNVDRLDDDGSLRVLAAHIAAMHGEFELAISHLRRTTVSTDGAGPIAEMLGVLLARTGRCDEANVVLQPVLQQALDKPHSPAWDQAAASSSDQVTRQWQTQDGRGHGAVRRALAACYLEAGAAWQAKQILHPYVEVHPADAPAQLLMAKAALTTADMTTALMYVEAAEAHDPGHAEVRLVRATLAWKAGDLETAAGTLAALIAATPDDVEAHCLLAEVMVGKCEPEAARAHFRRALELDPTCRWAAAGLDSLAAEGDS